MITLGCGKYEVYFKTRGGYSFVCRARNITQVSYSRTLNQPSSATISLSLSGQSEECCACIGSINPWEHEVSIYRDGKEVWCGPVVNAEIDLSNLTANFSCLDLFAWTDHRWIELYNSDYDIEDDTELTEVWEWILSHGYNKDPWNMTWTLGKTGVPMSNRFYPSYSTGERWGGSYPNCGEELRNLCKSGVDFTTICRNVIGGTLQTATEHTMPLITDAHWAVLPKIIISGGTMATEVGVAGGNGGYSGFSDDQMWIERPQDEYRTQFGLLQQFVTSPSLDGEDTTSTPNAITQQAFGLRELKKQPFVYVKEGELSKNAPVDFDTLIPGALIELALLQTCRTIQTRYRLAEVNVTFSAEKESVALQLTPEGAVALQA